MNRLSNDTELLRQGMAQSEFNDNAATIFRLDNLKKQANIARGLYSMEGLLFHLASIKGMELELAGKIDDNEKELLKEHVIVEIPIMNSRNMNYIYLWKRRLEKYERTVRELLQAKGLGITAKKEDDPRKAILGA